MMVLAPLVRLGRHHFPSSNSARRFAATGRFFWSAHGKETHEGRRAEVPRLRLLADLASAHASGVSGADAAGNPVFDASAGDLVPVRIDATGWAGGSTVSASDWDADSGVTLSAKTLAGAVASCQAFIPDTADRRAAYWVQNTLTLSTGLVRKTLVWLRAADRG